MSLYPSKGVIICFSVVAMIVALAIGLLLSSLRRLSTEEAAVQYDIILNKLGNRVYEAGLHFGPPGFKFITFPKVYKTIAFSGLKCLNADGLSIMLSVQFQYIVDTKKVKQIIDQFKDHATYLTVLRHIAEAKIHDSCSEYDVSQILSDRAGFQETICDKLSKEFKKRGSFIADVQVSNIQRPFQYETVIKNKEAAKQNIKIAQNERPRVITEVETNLREAETQAQITIQDAETQARIVKTQARATADAILTAYRIEADTYKLIMSKQNLTIEGLLSYLATRVIQSAKKPIYIDMEAPAQTKYP